MGKDPLNYIANHLSWNSLSLLGCVSLLWQVIVVTRLRSGHLRNRGSFLCRGKTIFFISEFSYGLRFTQLPLQWVSGALFPRIKWPGRENDHWYPSSADDKNWWSYTSTFTYALMTWSIGTAMHSKLCLCTADSCTVQLSWCQVVYVSFSSSSSSDTITVCEFWSSATFHTRILSL